VRPINVRDAVEVERIFESRCIHWALSLLRYLDFSTIETLS
jgi:hypothetical protein